MIMKAIDTYWVIKIEMTIISDINCSKTVDFHVFGVFYHPLTIYHIAIWP